MTPRALCPHPLNAPRPFRRRVLSLSLLWLTALGQAVTADAAPQSPEPGLQPIRGYIASGWDTLTRSLSNCETIVDPKLAGASVFYLPADVPTPPAVQQLEQKCKIQVQHLRKVIQHPGDLDPGKIDPPGLLYLENRYVVPGGRFNEMYGWDSYFIVVGLVRDGRIDLAKGMVENFFFEIQHYGTVLNANRTYYLTRSQPPFLTSMILEVYDAQKVAGHDDRAWLEKAYGFAAKDYENWVHEPHLAGSTGLSRYYDYGEGPAPESVKDETGHYRKVAAFFLGHPYDARRYLVQRTPQSSGSLVGPLFAIQVCDTAMTMARPECDSAGTFALSADYYKGDRAMRESGFDISFRFGPYGAATHHFAAVCLNSLLYKYEKDMEQIAEILGRKEDTVKWHQRADERKERIQKYLWDAKRGLFFDYDFEKQARSSYEYITTFYPLWAGLATPEQARAVARNLHIFEQPGGLVMSPHESGGQWDFPYAWAPTQLLAIKGMRRYGFNEDANRVSYEFLSNVAENFRREGNIREKYNAVTRSSETQVAAGYHQNVIGFGWTNGVFLELLHELPQQWVERLAKEQTAAAAAAH